MHNLTHEGVRIRAYFGNAGAVGGDATVHLLDYYVLNLRLGALLELFRRLLVLLPLYVIVGEVRLLCLADFLERFHQIVQLGG